MTGSVLDRATLLVQVAAAAAFGALLATLAVARDMTFDAPLVSSALAVVVAIGCVVGVGYAVRDGTAIAPARPQPLAYAPPPVQPVSGEIPWWEQAALNAARRTAAKPAISTPAASLIPRTSEIVLGDRDAGTPATRQIVQCPQCGAFDVQVTQEREDCAFSCQQCGTPWHWRPGAPWPVTVVRPVYRRRSTAPPAPVPPPVWRLNP